jgi:hypothetical protein
MNMEFASLMAQVIPVILLARIVQVRDRLTKLLRVQKEIREDIPHTTSKTDVAQKMLLSAIINGTVISMLVASEAVCVLAVAGPLPGPLAQKFVVWSVIVGTMMLGFDLVWQDVARPFLTAVRRASSESGWYTGIAVMGVIFFGLVVLSIFGLIRA